jgi:hypothetical protein
MLETLRGEVLCITERPLLGSRLWRDAIAPRTGKISLLVGVRVSTCLIAVPIMTRLVF